MFIDLFNISHFYDCFYSFYCMISNNFAVYSIKIIAEIIISVIFFPVWWYSKGLWNFLKKNRDFLFNKQKSLGLLVWVRNIFKPMYGQSDWQGKLISFFMRFIQIIFRSIAMLFWIVWSIMTILFWICLPLFVIYQIFYQLT